MRGSAPEPAGRELREPAPTDERERGGDHRHSRLYGARQGRIGANPDAVVQVIGRRRQTAVILAEASFTDSRLHVEAAAKAGQLLWGNLSHAAQ
jgi:hypothetical protein